VPVSTLQILRCQQTLERLLPNENGLFSPAAGLVYPVRNGIVYMGYDEREHHFMQSIIEAERLHQATPDAIEPSLAFLRTSSLNVIDLIRLVRKRTGEEKGLRGLEVGAGSGWASWLFAESGYEMWICELELNSLFLGQVYEHRRLGAGRRIACDATFVPFSDGSFDLVLCKEFAHHVADKKRLFREVNRVLKPGGLLVMLDPVRSLTSTLYGWRHPDPLPEHAVSWTGQYLRAIRSSGFGILEYGALSIRQAKRVPFTAWPARHAVETIRHGSVAHDFVTRVYLQLVGGQLVVVAEKASEAPRVRRPRIRVIDPDQLRVSPHDRVSFYPFRDLLEERARTYLGRKPDGPQPAAP
jgi:SAM-dependent methyltransferase